jgi:hypothetical protein
LAAAAAAAAASERFGDFCADAPELTSAEAADDAAAEVVVVVAFFRRFSAHSFAAALASAFVFLRGVGLVLLSAASALGALRLGGIALRVGQAEIMAMFIVHRNIDRCGLLLLVH